MTNVSLVANATQLVLAGAPGAALAYAGESPSQLAIPASPAVSMNVEAKAVALTAAAEQGPMGPMGPMGPQGPQGPMGPQALADLNPDFVLDGGNF